MRLVVWWGLGVFKGFGVVFRGLGGIEVGRGRGIDFRGGFGVIMKLLECLCY